MRILEFLSQNVKILYKPSEENLSIGDFVDLAEGSRTLMAQVYSISSYEVSGEYNLAEAVLLLTRNFGSVSLWKGEEVSIGAKVTNSAYEYIEKYITDPDEQDVFAIGYRPGTQNKPLKLCYKNFHTPAFIGYENENDNNLFLKEIIHQFYNSGKKLVIVDYNGNIDYEGATKIAAGYHKKLPLNAEMLEKISVKMLEGISADSRAVIGEVLLELSNYAKEAPAGFISISHLINVIDGIYKKSKIAQLIMLKNRLRTYQKQNIFADKFDEILSADAISEMSGITVFDLSNIPEEWQNEFLYQLLQTDNEVKEGFYFYLPITQKNTDNKLINYLLFKASKIGIKPILSANYRHVAMDNILDFSANSFLFAAHNQLKKRDYLNNILSSLPQEYCIIKGQLTASLPLPVYLGAPIDEFDEKKIEQINKETNETLDIIQNNIDLASFDEKGPASARVDMEKINTAFDKPVSAEIPKAEEIMPQESIPVEVQNENIEPIVNPNNIVNDVALVQENNAPIIPDSGLVPLPPVEDIGLSTEESGEDFVSEDSLHNLEEQEQIFDEEIESVNEDFEEDFSQTVKEENNEEISPDDLDFLDKIDDNEQSYSQSDEDELLDLLSDEDENTESSVENINVDELNFEDSEYEVNEAKQEEKIPVYEANYGNNSPKQSINLQEGDLVKHNKYGLGTVKKLLNHGSKVMCFVNFEDFGRRLLDPEISQLEKIK